MMSSGRPPLEDGRGRPPPVDGGERPPEDGRPPEDEDW